jgi:hypothetical protein
LRTVTVLAVVVVYVVCGAGAAGGGSLLRRSRQRGGGGVRGGVAAAGRAAAAAASASPSPSPAAAAAVAWRARAGAAAGHYPNLRALRVVVAGSQRLLRQQARYLLRLWRATQRAGVECAPRRVSVLRVLLVCTAHVQARRACRARSATRHEERQRVLHVKVKAQRRVSAVAKPGPATAATAARQVCTPAAAATPAARRGAAACVSVSARR